MAEVALEGWPHKHMCWETEVKPLNSRLQERWPC